VGHTWAVAARAVAPERTPPRLAVRKDGVAVAHQQDIALAARSDGGANGVAEFFVGNDLVADAMPLEKGADRLPRLIDAGLVVGVAVDVDELRQERLHGVFL